MKEEEKIFAGKIFSVSAEELLRIKHRTHGVCQKYNSLDENDPQRRELIKSILGKLGTPFRFQGPIQFNYGVHTFIGNGFISNFNFLVMDDGLIYIGNNVSCGPNVSLLATNHPLLAQERLGLDENGNATTFAEYAEEIHIEDNVWLAAGVSVLGGVRIGRNAVIGAGSVVSSDIPANTLAVGIPCRPIRTLTEKDSCRDRFLEEDKAYYKYNLK